VPVAAAAALPIIWPHGLTVALAAIPFARLGDRGASVAGWQSAVSAKGLGVSVALIVGGALVIALVAPDAVRGLMDEASRLLYPYDNRP
jgi:hypothetical protein